MAGTAETIVSEIRKFVRESAANRMPTPERNIMFDEPLVRFADGDDPIFPEYKKLIGPEHLTPREALPQAGAHISVINWILPITGATRKANGRETKLPSRLWSHTRWYGEIFNDTLRAHIVEFLTKAGYNAAAPALPGQLKTYRNDKGLYSNWSERHIAFAAGQGTFSLSDGFITERGIAHRCGSVVTDLELPASPRTAAGPYANCLFYAGTKCRACIERCPAGAITEKGHDKIKCQAYLRGIGYDPKTQGNYNLENSVAGCGLCQTRVPCEDKNPTAKFRGR